MRLLAAASPGEVRVAAVDVTGLVDYAIWRPGAPDGVGDLHRGRVTARAPAMAGTFVAIEGADGFLPDSAGGASASVGDVLGVRVTRAAQGGKGPRLTAVLDEPVPHGDAGLVRRGPDAVRRVAALHPDAEVAVDDPALFAALRANLGDRLALVARAFDEATEAMVEALEGTAAALPGGARMTVHPTPALTAIDVDLGSATAERSAKNRAQLAGNRALLPALARQIRLRNLSGAILVDLAGLSAMKRAALGPDFAAALIPDPLHPRFLGFTALGLAEIVRARVHPPLHELLGTPHAAGLAALRHLAREIMARPALVPALGVAPAVATALQADAIALADLARRAGRPLILRIERGLAPLGWRIEE